MGSGPLVASQRGGRLGNLEAAKFGTLANCLPFSAKNGMSPPDRLRNLVNPRGSTLERQGRSSLKKQKQFPRALSSGSGIVHPSVVSRSSDFGGGMLASPKRPGGSCPRSKGRETVNPAKFGTLCYLVPLAKFRRLLPSNIPPKC